MLWVAAVSTAGVYISEFEPGDLSNPEWYACNNGLGTADKVFRHLSCDLVHGNRLYACSTKYGQTGGNMFRNSDVSGFADWEHLALPAPAGYSWDDARLRVVRLNACPQQPDRVYCLVGYFGGGYGMRAWLYRSTDAGDSWTNLGQVPYSGATGYEAHSFSVLPSDPDAAWMVLPWLGRPKVFRVTGLTTGSLWATEVESYGLTERYTLASPDDDTRWTYYYSDTRRNGSVIWAYYGHTGSLVVESSARVRQPTYALGTPKFRGYDGGVTWEKDLPTPGDPYQTASTFGRGGYYLLGRSYGYGSPPPYYPMLWGTNDDGATWSVMSGPDGGHRLPQDCGGIPYIGVLRMTGVVPVGAIVPGGEVGAGIFTYNCIFADPATAGGIYTGGCGFAEPTGEGIFTVGVLMERG